MEGYKGLKKWVDLDKGFRPNVSASKINLFRNNLAMFIMNYGYGKRSSGSQQMTRGNLVEEAVKQILTKQMSSDDAIEKAQEDFVQTFADSNPFLLLEPHHCKEYMNLSPMINLSCEALEPYGIPIFDEDNEQQKITYEIVDGDKKIEAVGYLDFVFPNGKIVDLKTTNAMQSKMSAQHQLQRAIYKMARSNYSVEFLYVTNKKKAFYEHGNENDIIESAKIVINQMDNFCNRMTPNQARKCIPILDDYYWSGETKLKQFYNKE